jgi:allantoin racemase
MMPRILVLVPGDLDLDAEIAAARAALDPESELVARSVDLPSVPPVSAQDWALADLAMMAAGQAAETEGFDALVVGDFGDFGVSALRSLLTIPVVGAGKAAMLHALTLAASFTVLATARDIERARRIVHDNALQRQCAGLHEIADAEAVARHAAAAEAVILAGETAGFVAGAAHVPVSRPLAVAVKMAESFVGLGLTHSRRGYPEPEMRKAELIATIAKA